MKFKKIISSFLVSFMVLSTTAFAADVELKNDVKYEEGQNVTVGCYITAEGATNIGAGAYMQIDYTGLTYVSSEIIVGGANAQVVEEEPGMLFWEYNGTGSATIADVNQPLFTLTFSVDDIDNATVAIGEDCAFYFNDTTLGDVADVTVTIESATPPEPQPGDTTEAVVLDGTEKYMTVVDDSKATRYVVMDEKLSVPATGATVLKATYDGVTKQANLAKLLGVTIEEDGNINIGKLTIKMVLPAGAAQPTADIFGFVVE